MCNECVSVVLSLMAKPQRCQGCAMVDPGPPFVPVSGSLRRYPLSDPQCSSLAVLELCCKCVKKNHLQKRCCVERVAVQQLYQIVTHIGCEVLTCHLAWYVQLQELAA